MLALLDRALYFAVPAFAATWFSQVALTALGDPFGFTTDAVLWIAASILRWIALLTLLILLQRLRVVLSRRVGVLHRRAAFVRANTRVTQS